MQIYIIHSISTVRRMFNLNRSRNLDIKTGSNRSLPDCYTYRSIEISQPTFRCKHGLNLHLIEKSLSHFQLMNLCRDFKISTYCIYVISGVFLLSSRCHKLPWIGSLCRNYNPVPFPFSRILARVTALMTLVEHYPPSRST